jgi:hypothetical protein
MSFKKSDSILEKNLSVFCLFLKKAFLKLIQRLKAPSDVYFLIIFICLFFPLLFLIKNAWFSINFFFCSTLSEFENFLLCERILINVTTCQNETSS